MKTLTFMSESQFKFTDLIVLIDLVLIDSFRLD